MSLIIKGMEMPARCVDCRFCDEIDGTCIALNDNSTACITGKPKWCPLVEVPSADVVEVKRGEWLPNKYIYDALDCSICGHFVYDEDIPNFCPHCGADMRD